jgi:hypothetical protein
VVELEQGAGARRRRGRLGGGHATSPR